MNSKKIITGRYNRETDTWEELYPKVTADQVLMEGYIKPETSGAVQATDPLETALGKLEAAFEEEAWRQRKSDFIILHQGRKEIVLSGTKNLTHDEVILNTTGKDLEFLDGDLVIRGKYDRAKWWASIDVEGKYRLCFLDPTRNGQKLWYEYPYIQEKAVLDNDYTTLNSTPAVQSVKDGDRIGFQIMLTNSVSRWMKNGKIIIELFRK